MEGIKFINYLIHIDKQITLFINGFHHPVLDFLMYWTSYRFTWIPFYLILFIILFKKFNRKIIYILISAALMIVASDQSANFLKSHTHRLRPCHALDVSQLIHLVGNCGGNFGFVSGHSANSFALATFIILITKNNIRWLSTIMIIWACLLAYSRVYLGVHYIADVSVGAMLGIICGFIFFRFCYYIQMINYKNV